MAVIVNRLQSYFRARFYDSAIGEFSARDPLDYVDGMSLMRGYMETRRVDPLGWFCDDSILQQIYRFLSPPHPGEFERQWTLGEFVHHYVTCQRTTVNLGDPDVGLLDDFMRTKSVNDAAGKFLAETLGPGIFSNAKKLLSCDGTKQIGIIVRGVGETDVTHDSPPALFAVGGSTMFFRATCVLTLACGDCACGPNLPKNLDVDCNVVASIRDWFEEPLNIKGSGITLEVGCPYRINADFSFPVRTDFDLPCEIKFCNEN